MEIQKSKEALSDNYLNVPDRPDIFLKPQWLQHQDREVGLRLQRNAITDRLALQHSERIVIRGI